ncbi:hypothetical protein GCM10027610_050320 [Dactylosporangium cerinum]
MLGEHLVAADDPVRHGPLTLRPAAKRAVGDRVQEILGLLEGAVAEVADPAGASRHDGEQGPADVRQRLTGPRRRERRQIIGGLPQLRVGADRPHRAGAQRHGDAAQIDAHATAHHVSRAYPKPHTPRQRPGGCTGGMNHSASLRRVYLGLAVLGLACAVYTVRRPLMMSAPTCLAGRWHGCLDTENGVLLTLLAGLPLAALVVWALARRRGARGGRRWPRWAWSTRRCRSCG